jgi:hypothetical protein
LPQWFLDVFRPCTGVPFHPQDKPFGGFPQVKIFDTLLYCYGQVKTTGLGLGNVNEKLACGLTYILFFAISCLKQIV